MASQKLPIYLFSKTPHDDVTHIPILLTQFLQPAIEFVNYDAIVVTSKQAVTALGKISPDWKTLPILCVAEGTAQMAQESGASVLEYGEGYGERLADIIIERYGEKRWLYPRPEVVASDLGDRVKRAGVDLDEVVVYRSYCNPDVAQTELKKAAVMIFTSPSAIECFMKFFRFETGQKVVVIGETTKASLPEGVDAFMPEAPSVEACVALAEKLAG